MRKGQLRRAVRGFLGREKGGVLGPDDVSEGVDRVSGEKVPMTVREILEQKHPKQEEPNAGDLPSVDSNLPLLVDIIITATHVERVAHRLRGSAGPGGADAELWADWALRYGEASERLCDAVAVLCRCLANSIVPWERIRALFAGRLIALDKCPGVRPIGIGESLRRFCGKIVMEVTGEDVKQVCGSDQLCTGLEGGIEGAWKGGRGLGGREGWRERGRDRDR
jgi:hypothetical protein